jgi:subtilisin
MVGLGCNSERSMVAPEVSILARSVGPVPQASLAHVELPSVRVKQDPDRYDTPWRRMSDAEFANEVEKLNGRVTIGFKDVNARQGVDDMGRSLVTRNQVRSAIDALKAIGVGVRYEFKRLPSIAATVSGELAASLRRHPLVDFVEPAIAGEPQSQVVPWGLTKIGAPASWSLSIGSGVKLLIIDTGLDSAANDLSAPVQWRCIGTVDPRVYAWVGHGTHVSGIAKALNNLIDVVGAAYGATLWSANIAYDYVENGVTKIGMDYEEAACSIDLAIVNGVKVVNMSFGGVASLPNTNLTNAINDGFNNNGMIFVAAVGSDASAVKYPATLSNVIAVAAIDSTNNHPEFSNTGSAVDISAPGVAILSTWLPGATGCTTFGSTAMCDGTSMSAPHVSAAAAMLMARYPSWSTTAIRNRLLATATDLGTTGLDNTYGYGLVNVLKALNMQVGIGGPLIAASGISQNWSAVVSGGQSPFAYQWYADGSGIGTGSSVSYTPSVDFWLKLQVTDNFSLVALDSISVTVTSCPPPQIFC